MEFHIKFINQKNGDDIGIQFKLDDEFNTANGDKFLNYFTSIGAEFREKFMANVLYINVPNCKFDLVNLDISKPPKVGIAINKENGEGSSYIQLTYTLTDTQKKEEYLNQLKSSCNKYTKTVRTMFRELYRTIEAYWANKIQHRSLVNSLGTKSSSVNNVNEKNDQLNKQKKNYENTVNSLKAEKEKD